jgi:hypothetical protein
MFGIPHLELLGLIGALAVASVAGWSSANLNVRLRLVEQDLDDLANEAQSLRRALSQAREQVVRAPQQAARPEPRPVRWEPTAAPVFEPLYAQFADMAPAAATYEPAPALQPDVRDIAQQLGRQSRQTMEFMLTPTLDLSDAPQDEPTGVFTGEPQEERLARWLDALPTVG